uniref:Uncharacterized protein n=1 Tax=Candidatus Methanomethylicus mesodigestus TaxID=1867258 RepID=A0A7C3ER29_9CREN
MKVKSSLCDNETIITAELKGSTISLSFESTCSKIKDYGAALPSVNLKDIIKGFVDNPIFMAGSSSHVTPDCLVPSATVLACWAEAGFASKNLMVRSGPQCIILVK